MLLKMRLLNTTYNVSPEGWYRFRPKHGEWLAPCIKCADTLKRKDSPRIEKEIDSVTIGKPQKGLCPDKWINTEFFIIKLK